VRLQATVPRPIINTGAKPGHSSFLQNVGPIRCMTVQPELPKMFQGYCKSANLPKPIKFKLNMHPTFIIIFWKFRENLLKTKKVFLSRTEILALEGVSRPSMIAISNYIFLHLSRHDRQKSRQVQHPSSPESDSCPW
jgi:hypothetical protein